MTSRRARLPARYIERCKHRPVRGGAGAFTHGLPTMNTIRHIPARLRLPALAFFFLAAFVSHASAHWVLIPGHWEETGEWYAEYTWVPCDCPDNPPPSEGDGDYEEPDREDCGYWMVADCPVLVWVDDQYYWEDDDYRWNGRENEP
jgi:hypothetical protein